MTSGSDDRKGKSINRLWRHAGNRLPGKLAYAPDFIDMVEGSSEAGRELLEFPRP